MLPSVGGFATPLMAIFFSGTETGIVTEIGRDVEAEREVRRGTGVETVVGRDLREGARANHQRDMVEAEEVSVKALLGMLLK